MANQNEFRDDDLLTTAQAAQEIGGDIVRPQTLAKWRCEGRSPLPYFKVAGKVRYRRADCRAYRERSRIPAAEPAPV